MKPADVASVPAIVLDTNVVMDWLVFANPALATLAAAIAAARLRWIATDAMRDELAHVLGRGLDPRWTVDDAHWRSVWLAHAQPQPAPVAGHAVPRCSDADDQKFIDLAVVAGARWLLSRDKAVLKLARPLRTRHGVEVLTPQRWTAAFSAGGKV
jgi:predicted nucleic acid-binding protein